eukprot:361935-Chlamydomonas_euryale.AAC.8
MNATFAHVMSLLLPNSFIAGTLVRPIILPGGLKARGSGGKGTDAQQRRTAEEGGRGPTLSASTADRPLPLLDDLTRPWRQMLVRRGYLSEKAANLIPMLLLIAANLASVVMCMLAQVHPAMCRPLTPTPTAIFLCHTQVQRLLAKHGLGGGGGRRRAEAAAQREQLSALYLKYAKQEDCLQRIAEDWGGAATTKQVNARLQGRATSHLAMQQERGGGSGACLLGNCEMCGDRITP